MWVRVWVRVWVELASIVPGDCLLAFGEDGTDATITIIRVRDRAGDDFRVDISIRVRFGVRESEKK